MLSLLYNKKTAKIHNIMKKLLADVLKKGRKKLKNRLKICNSDYFSDCFSAISPTIGNLNFSPWYAFIINTSQRISSTKDINMDIIPANHHIIGVDHKMDVIIHPITITGKNVAIDCTAWNFTNLLSFSITRNTIPVINPRT